jgi:uncharacterized protein (DUF924 family)
VKAPEDILAFWFGELQPAQWFRPDAALDASIATRFGATLVALRQQVPSAWTTSARGTLAAVIVLDQFPRNIHRGTPDAFASDATALALAAGLIAKGGDRELSEVERQFLYMPYQHAEDLSVQERSLELYRALGNANVLDFATRHRDIIARFGRFPHRNAIVARPSTPEEVAFLQQPGSSF